MFKTRHIQNCTLKECTYFINRIYQAINSIGNKNWLVRMEIKLVGITESKTSWSKVVVVTITHLFRHKTCGFLKGTFEI